MEEERGEDLQGKCVRGAAGALEKILVPRGNNSWGLSSFCREAMSTEELAAAEDPACIHVSRAGKAPLGLRGAVTMGWVSEHRSWGPYAFSTPCAIKEGWL